MAKPNGARGVRDIDPDSTIDELEDAFECEDSGLHEISAEVADAIAKSEATEKRVVRRTRLVKRRASRTQRILAGERVPPMLEEAAET